MSSSKLLAILAGASIAVACGGVFVGHKAVQSAEIFKAEALAWHGKTLELQRRLEASQGIRTELEARLKEAQKGLTKEERRVLAEHQVGRPGTVSRRASSWLNVKAPSDHYWKGQTGRDKHGHAIWKAPEYSLRAGALVLRAYYQRHGICTVEGIVKRFSTCNHEEYISYLCRHLGLKPDEKFNIIQRIPELIKHMSAFETGRQVPESKIATLDILASI